MYQEPAIYVFQRTLTASQVLQDVGLTIDRGPFVWTAIWGTKTGNYTIRLGLPSNRKLMSSLLRDSNVVGTAQFPVVIAPQAFALNSQIFIDITDISAAPNTVEICFAGYHQFN